MTEIFSIGLLVIAWGVFFTSMMFSMFTNIDKRLKELEDGDVE